jgi:hypothetical protein
MISIQAFAISLVAVTTCALTSTAATTVGSVGDGTPSVAYIATSGEMIIQPDSEPTGLFDIQSASGIFMGNAILPPRGLGLDVNTANRISWAALTDNAFLMDFSLGRIAPAGLTQVFLLNDLTITFSGGFGTPHVIPDLVYTIPEPATPVLWGIALIALIRRPIGRK